jgi:hypothetical protein
MSKGGTVKDVQDVQWNDYSSVMTKALKKGQSTSSDEGIRGSRERKKAKDQCIRRV